MNSERLGGAAVCVDQDALFLTPYSFLCVMRRPPTKTRRFNVALLDNSSAKEPLFSPQTTQTRIHTHFDHFHTNPSCFFSLPFTFKTPHCRRITTLETNPPYSSFTSIAVEVSLTGRGRVSTTQSHTAAGAGRRWPSVRCESSDPV